MSLGKIWRCWYASKQRDQNRNSISNTLFFFFHFLPHSSCCFYIRFSSFFFILLFLFLSLSTLYMILNHFYSSRRLQFNFRSSVCLFSHPASLSLFHFTSFSVNFISLPLSTLYMILNPVLFIALSSFWF